MKYFLPICAAIVILRSTTIQAANEEIEEMKRKTPNVANRFTDEQLGAIKEKEKKWNDLKNVKSLPEQIFTTSQAEYVHKVRSCRGKNCFDENGNEPKSATTQTAAASSATDQSISVASHPPVTRRDYRTLTDAERKSFHSALNKLKTDKIDGVSKYDLLVKYHLPSVAPGAHFGCSFVPWHREYLKQMEVALRWEVKGTFIPYWDSTCDEGLPTPCDSIIWTNDFMGNNKGDVSSGPFSNWMTTQPVPGSNSKKITRSCGASGGDLFEPRDIDYINSKNKFQDAFCYCDDATFEINHGLVHVFVGGDMNFIPISPNDPIFWLHHCFIDYLWEQWRQKKQTRQQRENDYPPDDVSCGPDYYANSPMKPFPRLINKDGLSNNYTDELYTYKDRPTCPSNCPGPYLFCNTKVNPHRCLSKIKMGGNCKGFNGLDVCYKGKCVNNKCVPLVG